jgi:putative alpha-1,2-mannosidase
MLVFSALEFYPVCPVTGEFAIGSPLFRRLSILMENGKSLTINAPENSGDNVCVNQIQIKNQVYEKNYFNHQLMQQGGEILFDMKANPNFNRGKEKGSFPFSFPNY